MNENKTERFSQAGISAEEAVKNVINGVKLKIAKNKTYIAKVGEKEFTVKFHPAAKIRGIFGSNFSSYKYAAEEAVNHIKSVEEQFNEEYDGMIGENEFHMLTYPVVKTDEIETLDEESCLDRFACFVQICNMCAEDDVLQRIAELAVKKKDGTLHIRRIMPITAYLATDYGLNIIELVAKNTSGTEVDVMIQERTLNYEELQKVSSNPILDSIALVTDEK